MATASMLGNSHVVLLNKYEVSLLRKTHSKPQIEQNGVQSYILCGSKVAAQRLAEAIENEANAILNTDRAYSKRKMGW